MEQIPNVDFNTGLSIDFSRGMGPAVLGILAFVIPLAIRTYLKDRNERKEKAAVLHLQLCRMAYNSVTNAIKRGVVIEDKQEEGLRQLDRFYLLRVGREATFEEKTAARAIFDAIHGELCPGGTGTSGPPSTTGGTPSP